jgi:hypothetical protein
MCVMLAASIDAPTSFDTLVKYVDIYRTILSKHQHQTKIIYKFLHLPESISKAYIECVNSAPSALTLLPTPTLATNSLRVSFLSTQLTLL